MVTVPGKFSVSASDFDHKLRVLSQQAAQQQQSEMNLAKTIFESTALSQQMAHNARSLGLQEELQREVTIPGAQLEQRLQAAGERRREALFPKQQEAAELELGEARHAQEQRERAADVLRTLGVDSGGEELFGPMIGTEDAAPFGSPKQSLRDALSQLSPADKALPEIQDLIRSNFANIQAGKQAGGESTPEEKVESAMAAAGVFRSKEEEDRFRGLLEDEARTNPDASISTLLGVVGEAMSSIDLRTGGSEVERARSDKIAADLGEATSGKNVQDIFREVEEEVGLEGGIASRGMAASANDLLKIVTKLKSRLSDDFTDAQVDIKIKDTIARFIKARAGELSINEDGKIVQEKIGMSGFALGGDRLGAAGGGFGATGAGAFGKMFGDWLFGKDEDDFAVLDDSEVQALNELAKIADLEDLINDLKPTKGVKKRPKKPASEMDRELDERGNIR